MSLWRLVEGVLGSLDSLDGGSGWVVGASLAPVPLAAGSLSVAHQAVETPVLGPLLVEVVETAFHRSGAVDWVAGLTLAPTVGGACSGSVTLPISVHSGTTVSGSAFVVEVVTALDRVVDLLGAG